MTGFRSLTLVAAATGLFTAGAAQACSMSGDYKVPNALELATEADAIVLADVIGGSDAGDIDERYVTVRPTTLVKGSVLPGDINVVGWSLTEGEAMWIASDPTELIEPNPGALIGGCVRYMHKAGSTLLLFLERDGDGWTVNQSPFARTAEDVPSTSSPWVRAVAFYAEAGTLPRRDRKAFLSAKAADLNKSADPDDRLVGTNIRRTLAGKRRVPFD